MISCRSGRRLVRLLDKVRDRVVQEQLLNALPTEVRIWVSKHA